MKATNKKYGKISSCVVNEINNRFKNNTQELQNGIEILKKIMDNANNNFLADRNIKLGCYENDFYRRIQKLLSQLKTDSLAISIARMSINDSKNILRACKEQSQAHPELNIVISAFEASLKSKRDYFCQFKNVQNKVHYWHLIENMQWPLYKCDLLDMESGKRLPQLHVEAHEIADSILKGTYLPEYTYILMDKQTVFRKQFCALKALELGLISVEDFENYILAYSFVLDAIEYPKAKIRFTLCDIVDVEENRLKHLLGQSEFRFTDKQYQQFLSKAKELPAHQRKILKLKFNTKHVPSVYYRVSNNFLAGKHKGNKCKTCVLPAAVFDVARQTYFKDYNLTHIKRLLGPISAYQVAVDSKKNTHVVNYNFPGQPEMLKAGGLKCGHAYFPLHDRDYHVLMLDTIPDNIRSFLKWVFHELMEAGVQMTGMVKNSVFRNVDCDFFYFKYLYAEIKQEHPQWSKQEVYREMNHDLSRHLSEILSSIVGSCGFHFEAEANHTDEWVEYLDQFTENCTKPKGKLYGLSKIYYALPVNDQNLAKAKFDNEKYKDWTNVNHYFNKLFNILKTNKSIILTQFGIDVDQLSVKHTYNNKRYYGQLIRNEIVQFFCDHAAHLFNLYCSKPHEKEFRTTFFSCLRIDPKWKKEINKEILEDVKKIPPFKIKNNLKKMN